MQKKIRETIKYLCDKYNIPKPRITVECRDELVEVFAEIHYDVEYDTCEIKMSYTDNSPKEEFIRCIAHEFAHYITMDVMRLRALLVPKMDNDSLVDTLFVQALEIITKRLEPIFAEEVKGMKIWTKKR